MGVAMPRFLWRETELRCRPLLISGIAVDIPVAAQVSSSTERGIPKFRVNIPPAQGGCSDANFK